MNTNPIQPSSIKLNNKEVIHVVASADNQYAQHLGAMLISLLEHASNTVCIKFYIIDGGITEDNKQKLEKVATNYGALIHFIEAPEENDEYFITSRHITVAAYYRILISDLIPEDIDKVLYLDCDLIIREDIKKLWDVEIDNYCVAAAVDCASESRKIELNIPEEFKYFNSGVLLINLKLWRSKGILGKTLDFVKNNGNKLLYHDQDALNAILYDSWLELHPRWNLTNFAFHYDDNEFRKVWDGTMFSKVKQALENPCIVHFTVWSKPWNTYSNHPYKGEYYKYLSLTPWRNFKYSYSYSDMMEFYDKKTSEFIELFSIKLGEYKPIQGNSKINRECTGFAGSLTFNKQELYNMISTPTYGLKEKLNVKKLVFVGNSSTLENNHIDVFYKLRQLKNQDFAIVCPLSYGSEEYAKKLIMVGKKWFKERFHPLMDCMSEKEYFTAINESDVVINNYKIRQGGRASIAPLLLGKKVYMNKDSNVYNYYLANGLTVYDIESINNDTLFNMENDNLHGNSERVNKLFSDEKI